MAMVQRPYLQPVKYGKQPSVVEILHVPRLRRRQVAQYSRKKYKRNKKDHHDIYTRHYAKFLEDRTFGKRENSKTNSCSDVTEEGNDAHLSYHTYQRTSFIIRF